MKPSTYHSTDFLQVAFRVHLVSFAIGGDSPVGTVTEADLVGRGGLPQTDLTILIEDSERITLSLEITSTLCKLRTISSSESDRGGEYILELSKVVTVHPVIANGVGIRAYLGNLAQVLAEDGYLLARSP